MESYSVPSSPFDHYAVGDTDSSGDSVSYVQSSHSANNSPYTSSRRLTGLPVLASIPPYASSTSTMPSSSTSSSHSHLSLPSSLSTTASTSSSSSSSSLPLPSSPPSPPSLPVHSRPTRTKDRLKHSESENRRRTRLRHKFSLLRDSSSCVKKDRYTILTTAVAKLNELQGKLQQVEQEKAALLVNISSIQQHHHPHKEATPLSPPLSPLTSLSHYPLLSNIASAFISLDGRVVDVNSALCHLLRSSAEELVHSSLFALCDPVHLVDTVCVLKRMLDGECGNWEMYRWIIAKDGSRIRMHATIAPVHHEGRLVFFVLLMVPSVAEGRSSGKEGYDPLDHLHSSSYHQPSLPPPVEPKHELDTRLPYSNAYPSPPYANRGDGGEGLMASPPAESSSDLRFFQSVESLNGPPSVPLKVEEDLGYFDSRPTPTYTPVQAHEGSGSGGRGGGHPPLHRPPSSTYPGRRAPASINTGGHGGRGGMGISQSGGLVMDGRGGWARPSLSAPSSPAGRKSGSGAGQGGRGGMGAVGGLDDWMYTQGMGQQGLGMGGGEVDGEGARPRAQMVG